jgi:arabinose-5-phosphate isomerase
MDGISIMSAKRLGHVIIAKDGDLIGIFSDGDLRRALQSHPHEDIVNMSLTNFATMNPVVVGSDAIVEEAVHIMEVRKITALPVTDGGVLVGLVHLHDILESRVV